MCSTEMKANVFKLETENILAARGKRSVEGLSQARTHPE